MNCRTAILLISASLVMACGTTPTIEPIPCPPRPELIEVPAEYEVDPDVQAIVAENYLRLVTYAKKIEARASCDR